MKQTETIGGRKCTIYTAAGAEVLLLQAVDDHDQSLLDSEVATARSLTDVPFNLVAFGIKEWMRELTPWPAPPTFGKQPFGDGAEETLDYVRDLLLPLSTQRWGALPAVMGGYSLAGLFSLWAGCFISQYFSITHLIIIQRPIAADWIDDRIKRTCRHPGKCNQGNPSEFP